MGDARPLPGNPSDSVNEGKLTQTLDAKDLTSPMSGRTVSNQKNGDAREDQIVSGRVSTPGGEPKRGKFVLSLSHPPLSFSAEFLKMADKCSDKDKDLSSDRTGPRTRSDQIRLTEYRLPGSLRSENG